MRGPRPNTTRLRVWVVGLACGLGLAAGCHSKAPPARREGGATTSKADKARKDAEALAVSAAGAGASAQARAVPEAAARRDKAGVGFLGRVVAVSEAVKSSVGFGKTDTAVAAPPAPSATATAPAAGPAPGAPTTAPAPRVAPRPGPPAVVRERVVSTIPYPTEAEAEEDALGRARELVERKMAELDPPVRYKPSVAEVKAEFVRRDSRTVRPPTAKEREMFADLFADYGATGNRVYVEYDVEITSEQVRELRTQERAGGALRVLGLLVAVALAGFLFLRADEWTKGYLTSWLALAAVALAGGAAAALVFV